MAEASNRLRDYFDQIDRTQWEHINAAQAPPAGDVVQRFPGGGFCRQFQFTFDAIELQALIRFDYLPQFERFGWSVYLDTAAPKLSRDLVHRICDSLLPHVPLVQSFSGVPSWGGASVTLVETRLAELASN